MLVAVAVIVDGDRNAALHKYEFAIIELKLWGVRACREWAGEGGGVAGVTA